MDVCCFLSTAVFSQSAQAKRFHYLVYASHALVFEPQQAAFDILFVAVYPLVVPAQDSVVVQEYASREVSEWRALAIELEALEAALQDAVQRVRLHLFFQVWPVVAEVVVLKDAFMHR